MSVHSLSFVSKESWPTWANRVNDKKKECAGQLGQMHTKRRRVGRLLMFCSTKSTQLNEKGDSWALMSDCKCQCRGQIPGLACTCPSESPGGQRRCGQALPPKHHPIPQKPLPKVVTAGTPCLPLTWKRSCCLYCFSEVRSSHDNQAELVNNQSDPREIQTHFCGQWSPISTGLCLSVKLTSCLPTPHPPPGSLNHQQHFHRHCLCTSCFLCRMLLLVVLDMA